MRHAGPARKALSYTRQATDADGPALVILGFAQQYPPDECERRLPDVAAARALLGERCAVLDALFAQHRAALGGLVQDGPGQALLARSEDATVLAYARLALRHGRLGHDLHPYHNEGHALDLCGERLAHLIARVGVAALDLAGWCSLLLFGACHDLRQREAPATIDGVGANERASWEECARILAACGFDAEREASLFIALELAIAGSTFDARPLPSQGALNAADLVHSGGALAARLEQVLDQRRAHWRSDPRIGAALPVALIAADLDTANVAEPFARFAEGGEALCREREMLAGRSLDEAASALPVLAFLGEGQSRFFFDLHRFNSPAGIATFGAGKAANAPRLKALNMGLRARIALEGPPRSGAQVLDAYRLTVEEVGGA
ncbi:MAG: hypothetical protein F9K31_09840 [Dokdonella sp.]|nr:MAG: hypothetical protein F9K31_09840 [Dokdonella sp.]